LSLDTDSTPLASLDDIGRALDELDAKAPQLPEPEEAFDDDLIVELLDDGAPPPRVSPIISGEAPWTPVVAPEASVSAPEVRLEDLESLDYDEADALSAVDLLQEATQPAVSARPLETYTLAEILSGYAAPWVEARSRECAAALRPVTVAHWLCRSLSSIAAREAPDRIVEATLGLVLMQLGEKLAQFEPQARVPARLFGQRQAIEAHLQRSVDTLSRRLHGNSNSSRLESAQRLVALLSQVYAVFETLQSAASDAEALEGLRDLLER
jgi:hypothetical protein